MTTYGHFTKKVYDELGGSPYFEQAGRWFRLTETYAISALDRVNYQAEELTDAEVAAMQAAVKAEKYLAERVIEPQPEPQPLVLDPTPRFIRPGILEWAKTQPEYAGRGPVSRSLRTRYAKEFGMQLVPGQLANNSPLDEDE